MERTKKILVVTSDNELKNLLGFTLDGWGYQVFFESSSDPEISAIVDRAPDLILIDINAGERARFELCDRLKRDFATAYIPVITLMEKEHLRGKLLALKEGVDDYLIKPPDALDLRVRIEMAMKRSQHSLFANPLTGLPGGPVIEDMIRERVDLGESFVTGHIDIDNFKAYNDKYGYLNGDRIIMQTAYMLSTARRVWGNKNDFIGHIGGDDFVLISTPDKYKEFCQNFICMFDTITPFHYAKEDRKRGYIMSKGRTNRTRKIPLMSVTVALVIKNNPAELNNAIELNERIAEVKQYLKKIPASKYMADRRIINNEDHLTLQVFNNDDSLLKSYMPLGQILIERKWITIEQLDKALKIHWRKGAYLGKVISDLGYASDDIITEALNHQEKSLIPKY
ncbi:MAG: diguanylate cyclase [Candidatus Omnitrophica bacterium]|nr:diguanylate cyclase [Candidatus Omnitrophota bacterium]